jgi:hypothetical protein
MAICLVGTIALSHKKSDFGKLISTKSLFTEVIAAFIGTFMPSMAYLNPEFQPVVNA